MIEELSVEYQVKESCAALGVSRSGYYQWKKGAVGPRAQQQQRLVAEIQTIFEQNHQRYGSPRVSRELWSRGQRVGKNRVARLMRERQLVARKKRAYRPKTTVAGQRAEPNRIATLEPQKPDQIWGE
jgi:putative transposase